MVLRLILVVRTRNTQHSTSFKLQHAITSIKSIISWYLEREQSINYLYRRQRVRRNMEWTPAIMPWNAWSHPSVRPLL
jgi:hypothetical protein